MAYGKNGTAVTTPLHSKTLVAEQQDAERGNQPITQLRVLIARVCWCFVGPSLLAMWAIRMATKNDGWFAPSDAGFLSTLGLVIGARWYCFSANDRTDTQGNITSLRQLQDFTRLWIIGGIVVWVATNLIGNFAH